MDVTLRLSEQDVRELIAKLQCELEPDRHHPGREIVVAVAVPDDKVKPRTGKL